MRRQLPTSWNQGLIDGFLDRFRAAAAGTQPPSAFNVVGAMVYGTVLCNVAFMDLIMFAVNAFGFIALGMFTLFGPLMIPLFITRNFKQKFWHWVDGLLVFSMFRAVSAAVSFIYANVLIGFFDNTVAGDYSLGHWLALIPALILLNSGFLWSMFQVPRLTGMIFGGVAGQAQGFVDTITSSIVALAGTVVHLATRPLIYRYIRIEEAGRTTPITYNDLDYSPREAEIRTFLTDWATFRYSMLRNSVAKTYLRNYYFLQDALASKLMQLDSSTGTIAKVITGQAPENEVQVNNVTFYHSRARADRTHSHLYRSFLDKLRSDESSTPNIYNFHGCPLLVNRGNSTSYVCHAPEIVVGENGHAPRNSRRCAILSTVGPIGRARTAPTVPNGNFSIESVAPSQLGLAGSTPLYRGCQRFSYWP